MARAQLLEAAARRQTLAHIAECRDCADRLAEQQALTAAVRATAKSLRDENASARVEQSLRAAFRKQMGDAPGFSYSPGKHSPVRARQWPKRALLAMAAMLLLFLLAGAIRQWSFADRNPKTATRPPAPKVDETVPEHPSPIRQSEPAIVRQVVVERHRTRPAIRPATTGNDDTEFIALAIENQLIPLESGQVLRVELPASTLISMGLRITAEDVSKPVLADLLVGQDGLPRAIRFVRPGETTGSGSPEASTNK